MMLSLCAVIMQTTLLVSSVETPDAAATYTEAREQVVETGKPLVVMVGTDWCGPCQNMKRNILPKVRELDLFKKVVFALVNADRESELAKELTGGGPVPQLVLFRKTEDGWKRSKLIGSQDVEAVQQFINTAFTPDRSESEDEVASVVPPSNAGKSASSLNNAPAQKAAEAVETKAVVAESSAKTEVSEAAKTPDAKQVAYRRSHVGRRR